jgi:trigger factor
MMNIQVSVEKASPISRKLTIKIPAQEVTSRFNRSLGEVQKTARIKGFRPGMAPIHVIKQFYGSDVRHNLLHRLIDESFQVAVEKEKIQAVGSPKIDTPENQTGHGEHDHTIDETKDFTFTATVDVLPEIEPKGYTGIALTKDAEEVSADDVKKSIQQILDSRATLTPAKDATVTAKKSDFVDLEFKGGVVTEKGLEERAGMQGARLIEIGSDQLIEGFEDQLVGMKSGETKTFQIPFPKDYFEQDLAGKKAEFTVSIKGIQHKETPALDDELAKELGYEGVADLNAKAKEHLTSQKTGEVERKLRSDLLAKIIEQNTFDCPVSLVQAQARALAQDVAQNLKSQGFTDQMIQEALGSEMVNLSKRAENQVRASLILEAIAKKESLTVDSKDVDAEITTMATSMKVDEAKIREFYLSNPRRRDDMEFKLREEKTMKFLIEKSKVKTAK